MKQFEIECDDCHHIATIKGLHVADDLTHCPFCGSDAVDTAETTELEMEEYEE